MKLILSEEFRRMQRLAGIITEDTSKELNKILDKINKKGIESLTPQEKIFLNKYSNSDSQEKIYPDGNIPSGWSIRDIEEYEEIMGDTEGEYGNIVKIYAAPMEGWDEENDDLIFIEETDDGKYYVTGYEAFGEFDDLGPFNDYSTALKYAIATMEATKDEWKDNDEEDDDDF